MTTTYIYTNSWSHLQAAWKGNQLWSLSSLEHRHNNYSKLEWSLFYVEVNGVLLLIFATIEGKGKFQIRKSFNYGKTRNIEYEDSDSPNIFLDVESSMGTYCPF